MEFAIDNKEEFVKYSFQPLVMMFDGLRVVFTRDTDWELKENPFLYTPHKLSANTRDIIYSEYLHTLFEVFHFEVFIETMTSSHVLNNRDCDTFLKHNQNLSVYPKQTKLTIDLPMIIANMSIQSIYLLLSLVKIWSGSDEGVKFQDVSAFVCLAYRFALDSCS